MAKLRQIELANKMGLDQSTISYMENGYITPTDQQKENMAVLMGCLVEEIDWQCSH